MKTKTIESVSKLTQKLQRIFNTYIRLRDKDLPCISCGSRNDIQAGHFFSAGHHTWLRFNEDNCHSQCRRCNYFFSGNLLPYREGLLKKIGAERLAQLELKAKIKTVTRYSRFELEILITHYKQKIKELNK